MSKSTDIEAYTDDTPRRGRKPGSVQFQRTPGSVQRYLRQSRVALDLPPIDIADPVQVEKRILEYFDFCEKQDKYPTITGMGNWIGVHRDTVRTWATGEYRGMTVQKTT